MSVDPEEEYDDDLEYEDDPSFDDDDPFAEEFSEEEEKPEPMAFPDGYTPAAAKPVELEVPGHSDAFKVLSSAKESRFPAKRVAKSAAELAAALRRAAAAAK
jgi:hypothetical protein